MQALTQRHHDQLVATSGVLVHANESTEKACTLCSEPLHVQKTTARNGRTLAHGHFIVDETIYFCPACKMKGLEKNQHLFVKRQEALKTLRKGSVEHVYAR